jgi:endonuclease-3
MNLSVGEKIAYIHDALSAVYPDPKSELNYSTPFQLLVATILAAQATDRKVNEITAELFRVAPDAERMSTLDLEALKSIVRPINYYNNKAKNIHAVCRLLLDNYQGKVPGSREALENLPGVGRKTANIVLSNAFGVPVMPVDTHVHRVSNRIGLVHTTKPEETETALMKIIPESWVINFHHFLVLHGRYTCKAKKPDCPACPVRSICDYQSKT